MQDTKKLNIQCTLGAVNLRKQGSFGSFSTRHRLPTNQTSTFDINYENYANSNLSQNLKSITKGNGGVIPRLNLSIGAPKATFAEGSIGPGLVHGIYNLLRAAQTSKFSNDTYVLPPGSKSTTFSAAPSLNSQTQTSIDQLESQYQTFYKNGYSGYIPLKLGEYQEASTPNTTYNIWKQVTLNDIAKKFLIGFGVVNYEKLGSPHIETAAGKDIPGIIINAANNVTFLQRIFPIADDLAYNDTDIYFKSKNSNTIIKRKILAKGGSNCGFWLSFENLTEFGVYKTKNYSSKSSIKIYFGSNIKRDKTIGEFMIVITDIETILRFINPFTGLTQDYVLSNKAIPTSGKLDIFVHFAGPNMYIGFDKEVSNWNVVQPFNFSTNSDVEKLKYNPYIDEKSIIQLALENLNCTFYYSPICFDSFDDSKILDTPEEGSNYTNPYGLSEMQINFDVSKTETNTLESISETMMNLNLVKRKNPSLNAGTAENLLSETEQNSTRDAATYFSDWRRQPSSQEEIIYKEKLRIEKLTKAQDPRVIVQGVIQLNTTIEGPIYFYARNFKEEEVKDPGLLNKPIWNQYSDISKYFSSCTIEEKFENVFQSFKTTSATIQLVNIANDDIGRQILNALQENLLTITIKAGYDNDLSTYFQGMIHKTKVIKTNQDIKVTLSCDDLGMYLINNTRFPSATPIQLGLRAYGDILKELFELAGLELYYKPRPRNEDLSFDVLWDHYFNTTSGFPNAMPGLSQPIMQASVNDHIGQIAKKLVDKMYYSSTGDGNFNKFLPILRYDPSKENYIISVRGDELPENIWLAGDLIDEQQLRNENGSFHGVATNEGWIEETDLNNLNTEVRIFGKNPESIPIVYQSNDEFKNRANSDESFAKLENLVKEGNEYQENLGYIGFNKLRHFVEESIQDPYVLRKYFDVLEFTSRYTIQSLEMNIYVEKPLNSHLNFTVQSFDHSGSPSFNGEYVFSKVTYTVDSNINVITAKVEGLQYQGV